MLAVMIQLMTVTNENVDCGHVVLFGDLISSRHFHFPLACHLQQLLLYAAVRACACDHVLRGRGIAQRGDA